MRLMLYIVNSCQQTAKLYKNGGLISGLRILFVRPTVIFAASDAQIADRCGQEREEQFSHFSSKRLVTLIATGRLAAVNA